MIKVTSGDDFIVTCRFKKNNQLVDLSTWEIKAAIRVNSDSGAALLQGQINNISNGTFTASFSQETPLKEGQYVLSVRLHNELGPTNTVNQPILIIKDQNW
jgi:hypothetical protein